MIAGMGLMGRMGPIGLMPDAYLNLSFTAKCRDC